MAEEDQVENEEGGGKKNIILFGVVLLVAIASSVGGTLFFLGGDTAAPEQVEVEVSDTPVEAVYHNMRPPFIINYLTGSKPRYLQAEVSIMSRNPAAIETVIAHMPLIRSEIVSFLTDQNFLELQTQEGKEAVRAGIVDLINQALAEREVTPGIESALLTNFVLQ